MRAAVGVHLGSLPMATIQRGQLSLTLWSLPVMQGGAWQGPIAGKPAPTQTSVACRCRHGCASSLWGLARDCCASSLWERACPRCRRRLAGPCRWQASSHTDLCSLSMSTWLRKQLVGACPRLLRKQLVGAGLPAMQAAPDRALSLASQPPPRRAQPAGMATAAQRFLSVWSACPGSPSRRPRPRTSYG